MTFLTMNVICLVLAFANLMVWSVNCDPAEESSTDSPGEIVIPDNFTITPQVMSRVFDELTRCTMDHLKLSDLKGSWQMVYYSKPVESDFPKTKITLDVSGETATGSLISNENVALNLQRVNLNAPTFLLNTNLDETTGRITSVSMIVLANKQDNYFSLVQVHAERADQTTWGIYQKQGVPQLDQEAVSRTTKALKCLAIKPADRSELLYPVDGQTD